MNYWNKLNKVIIEETRILTPTQEQESMDKGECMFDNTPLIMDGFMNASGSEYYELYCPECGYVFAED